MVRLSMLMSEPLFKTAEGKPLSEQLGEFAVDTAFKYRHTLATDPFERSTNVHQILEGVPEMIRRSETRIIFSGRTIELPAHQHGQWNPGLKPTDEHAVIWLGWTAVGEIQSRRRISITGRMVMGGNELAEGTDPMV